MAEMEEDGRARLRFGDNEHGMRPEISTEFRAEYREGNGPQGNIGAGTIRHVVDGPPGIRSLQNPLPAWGGEAPESLERVRAFAPEAFKVQERAVTEEDYARMAERHPEVQRAAATLRPREWFTVFLTIDRRGGRVVSEDGEFVRSILQYMDRFRMTGHDLEIRDPRFVPLDIEITVCVEPEHFRGEIQLQLERQLGSRMLADGWPGFFHPDRWSFGQSILSQIYAAIHGGSRRRLGGSEAVSTLGAQGERRAQDRCLASGAARGRAPRQRSELSGKRAVAAEHAGWAMSSADHQLDACRCCEGVRSLTPEDHANRPGLPVLAYRVATHGSFKATMLARLSRMPALGALGTRADEDLTIALWMHGQQWQT